MITNKRSKVALVHVARNKLGLSDENYRAVLAGTAGIESATEIEWEDQFRAVMAGFEELGFKSWKKEGRTTSRPQWTEKWGCNPAQRAKIEVMWRTCARNKSDEALWVFMKRITHVDHPRFVVPSLARKVIIALEKMMLAAGYDPVTGGRLAQ